MSDLLADRIFDASRALGVADGELFDVVCGDGKIDGNKFEDWHFDPYDDSIEFDGCADDMAITEADQKLLWSVGFERCWLNHKDGTETYYWHGGAVTGQRKPKR